ncbi:ATP-binding protein [Streptomyces sp. NPDC091290]|uniref:ATP-binding protein n=1 Tax=Streptomyces TaxID=1883 RepID=UPI00211B7299|nr:ATP-binding protein [Streptomyces viridochromogenes]
MSQEQGAGGAAGPAGDHPHHGPLNPAEARGAVRRALAQRPSGQGTPYTPDTLSDALLVASELTTNAMLHGGGVTDFDVEVVGENLYLSVCDRERRHPVTLDSLDRGDRHRCGGRGWPIVCRLACEVEVSDLPAGGKRVTAVIPLLGPYPRPGGA